MKDGIIYADGAFRPAADAAVSVFDHGLLYGDGVFEGIRAYNGRVFKLERHIERLFESARAIRLRIPVPQEDVEALVLDRADDHAQRLVAAGEHPVLGHGLRRREGVAQFAAHDGDRVAIAGVELVAGRRLELRQGILLGGPPADVPRQDLDAVRVRPMASGVSLRPLLEQFADFHIPTRQLLPPSLHRARAEAPTRGLPTALHPLMHPIRLLFA